MFSRWKNIRGNWETFSGKCAIAVVLLALIALFGYIPDLEFLARIKPSYIPMAPATAMCFIVLGHILFFSDEIKENGNRWRLFSFLIILVIVFSIHTVLRYFNIVDLNIERIIVSDSNSLDGIPIGFMSPVTGFSFFLLGISVLIGILPQV